MATSVTRVRVLIASPTDVQPDRDAAAEALLKWNAINSSGGVILEAVRWETHATPSLAAAPQAVINKQLVDDCDIAIALFWSKLGTPTADAESGTAEEIARFRAAGKPVLVYFSSRPMAATGIDPGEMQKVIDYRSRLHQEGLYGAYESLSDLQAQLVHHLTNVVTELGLPAREIAPYLSSLEPDAVSTWMLELRRFSRRLKADWDTERASEPLGTQGGKWILENGSRDLASLLADIPQGSEAMRERLLKLAARLRSHSNVVMTIGIEAWEAFWNTGSEIVDAIASISDSGAPPAPGAEFGEPLISHEQIQIVLDRPTMSGRLPERMEIQHRGANLFRIPITNRGDSDTFTLKLAGLEPMMPSPIRPTLHLVNDNPRDRESYKEECTILPRDTVTFDVLAAVPAQGGFQLYLASIGAAGHWVPVGGVVSQSLTVSLELISPRSKVEAQYRVEFPGERELSVVPL